MKEKKSRSSTSMQVPLKDTTVLLLLLKQVMSHVRYSREPAMEIMAITFCYYKITIIIIESSAIIEELEIRTPRTRGKTGNNR